MLLQTLKYHLYLSEIEPIFRITFDRAGLGTHSIPDYEILSLEPPDLLPIQAANLIIYNRENLKILS